MFRLQRKKYTSTKFRIVTISILGVSVVGILATALLHVANAVNNGSTSTGTFSIPELGIALTLPNGLSPADLQYSTQLNRPVTNTDPHSWSTVSITTKSLLQLDSACTADESSIGIIVRYTEDPKAINAEVSESHQIGKYYYAIATPQGPCSENPQAEKLQVSQAQLLQQAFASVKASN